MKLTASLILTLFTLLSSVAYGNSEAEALFQQGFIYYDQDQYAEAIPILEKTIALEPENAEYHHVLAKSYGKEASNSGWFKAINLAKKTIKHLEIARQFDPENLVILDDLMEFYREAPGFLGGSEKKADEIEQLIKKLSHKQQAKAEAPDKIE